MLSIHVQENNHLKATMIFDGELDIDATELIEEVCTILAPYKYVYFDFEKVSFVDSSGIGLLIQVVHELKENEKLIKIIHLQEEVKQVFLLLNLPEIIGSEVCLDI